MNRYLVYALYVIGLISLPLIAWLVGFRGEVIENRDPASAPTVAFNRLADTELYREATAYLQDQLPIRSNAINANAQIDYELFADPPNDRVLVGADGWLFLRQSVDMPCGDAPSVEEAYGQMLAIDQVLWASGRQVVWHIAPNKEAVHPERAAPFEDLRGCVSAKRTQMQDLLVSSPLVFVDGWETLGELKSSRPGDVYYPFDSHWNKESATTITAALMETMASGLYRSEDLVVGEAIAARVDLFKQAGLTGTDTETSFAIERGGTVSNLVVGGGFKALRSSQTSSVPVVAGTTLVVLDSFGEIFESGLRQYFATSLWLDWRNFEREPDALQRTAEQMAAADLVVIEVVERAAYNRFGRVWDNLDGQLVADLWEDLEPLAIPFSGDETGEVGEGYLVAAPGAVTGAEPIGRRADVEVFRSTDAVEVEGEASLLTTGDGLCNLSLPPQCQRSIEVDVVTPGAEIGEETGIDVSLGDGVGPGWELTDGVLEPTGVDGWMRFRIPAGARQVAVDIVTTDPGRLVVNSRPTDVAWTGDYIQSSQYPADRETVLVFDVVPSEEFAISTADVRITRVRVIP